MIALRARATFSDLWGFFFVEHEKGPKCLHKFLKYEAASALRILCQIITLLTKKSFRPEMKPSIPMWHRNGQMLMFKRTLFQRVCVRGPWNKRRHNFWTYNERTLSASIHWSCFVGVSRDLIIWNLIFQSKKYLVVFV